jgi:hypothetical protein
MADITTLMKRLCRYNAGMPPISFSIFSHYRLSFCLSPALLTYGSKAPENFRVTISNTIASLGRRSLAPYLVNASGLDFRGVLSLIYANR